MNRAEYGFTHTAEQARAILVAALRSGEYEQGNGRLRRKSDAGDCFCCLGVACDQFEKHEPALALGWQQLPAGCEIYYGQKQFQVDALGAIVSSSAVMPKVVSDWLGIRTESGDFEPFNAAVYDYDHSLSAHCLYTLNDSCRWPFTKIADVIENPLPGLLQETETTEAA